MISYSVAVSDLWAEKGPLDICGFYYFFKFYTKTSFLIGWIRTEYSSSKNQVVGVRV